MVKDLLENLSESEEWFFEYGRADFNNLTDVEENKELVHLFLDPVTRGKKRNDSGVVESKYCLGSFMMLFSSSIDEEDYNERFEKYIKPILESELEKIEDYLICEGQVSIVFWEFKEVINVFDYNCDGLIVNYKITYDE